MLLNPNPCCRKPCECCKPKEGGGSSLEGVTFTFIVAGLAATEPEIPETGVFTYLEVDAEDLNQEYVFGPDDYGECLTATTPVGSGCKAAGNLESAASIHCRLKYYLDGEPYAGIWDGEEWVDTYEYPPVEIGVSFILWYSAAGEARGVYFDIHLPQFPEALIILDALAFHQGRLEEDQSEQYQCDEFDALDLPDFLQWNPNPNLFVSFDDLTVQLSSSAPE